MIAALLGRHLRTYADELARDLLALVTFEQRADGFELDVASPDGTVCRWNVRSGGARRVADEVIEQLRIEHIVGAAGHGGSIASNR